MFTIDLLNSPTNPYYIIDYNDSSKIDLPAPVINGDSNRTSLELNHTFIDFGIFNVNVTVFNNVSSITKLIKVSI